LKNTVQEIINNFIHWGTHCENLKAAVLFGSQARTDGKADMFSDLDIILVVDDDALFLTTDQWLNEIGRFSVSFTEDSCDDTKMRRVIFNNGLDADLVFVPESRIDILKNGHTAHEIECGYKVIIDKIGIQAKLIPIDEKKQFYCAPTQQDFINLVNDFWFHVVWATKKLKRGELWAAKYCVDNYMKERLLTMIEHNARAIHGIEYNTWYDGRYLHEWANPYILQALSECFAHYNGADIKRALIMTIDLFRKISVETAEIFGFTYPKETDAFVVEWVHSF